MNFIPKNFFLLFLCLDNSPPWLDIIEKVEGSFEKQNLDKNF